MEKKNKKINKPEVKIEDSRPSLPLLPDVEEILPAPEVLKEESKNLKLYFNSDTQIAIVKYQTEQIKKEKDRLYIKEILPAFEKLVENLINIHKFSGVHETYDELKNDCVNFLFETLGKFDATRGTNAFSYFNVVAKNWLIIKTKQKNQRSKKSVSLDDLNSLTQHETKFLENHNTVHIQEDISETNDILNNTVDMLYDIRSRVKTENELICINSIITIFENIDDVDILNKSAVLLYMRELSGLSPKQLTTAMQSIKKHYKKIKSINNKSVWLF